MPYSVSEFAAQLKEKYPDYASWPDDHLVAEVVAKHPEYQSWVTLDPRTAIQARAINPPATAHGDPNAGGLSLLDVGGAIGKGLAHFVGIPTSVEGLKGAAKNAALMAFFPPAAMAKQAIDMPMGVASAVKAVAGPARAVANDNAPTDAANLDAIESGTTLSAMAAAPKVIKAAAGAVAPMMERSAMSSMGDAIGGPDTPLRETIASQLLAEGKKLTNPQAEIAQMAKERGTYTRPTPQVEVAPDGSRRVIPTADPNLPESEMWQQAGREVAPNANTAPPSPAKGMLTRLGLKGALTAGATAIGGPVAGKVVGGALGASEGLQLAKNILTSPLAKSMSAVAKSDLAQAMKSGNWQTVTDIAGRVIGADSLNDRFGHDEAVRNAVNDSFAQAQGNPQAARQILSGKTATYENADGTEVPIPYAIFRAFVNQLGWNVSNGYQPLAQSNGQGGQDSAGGQGGNPITTTEANTLANEDRDLHPLPGGRYNVLAQREALANGQAPPLQRTSNRDMAEWPVPANRVGNENEQLLATHTPAQLLPERFANARQVRYGVPLNGSIAKTTQGAPPDTYGLYGTQFTAGPQSGQMGNTYDNSVLLDRQAQDMTDVVAHETFHAVYNKDLTPDEKAQFRAIYDGAVAGAQKEIAAAGISPRDPEAAQKATAIAKRMLPAAILATLNGQGATSSDTRYDEAFSELGGQYMMNPTKFRETYPQIYGWFRQLVGKEYTAPKGQTFVPLGDMKNKPAWEYPGGMK